MGGLGLEFQFDLPIDAGQRLGARTGWEMTFVNNHENSGSLVSLGARYYPSEQVWLGLDGFRLAPQRSAGTCGTPAERAGDCAYKATGMLAGFGLEGGAGNRAGIGVGLATLLGFLVLAGQAHYGALHVS
jgi:hypothetical protein